jgi:single-strand DNA-binding protein
MSGLNRVFLLGNVASDPEVKHFEGASKLTFRIGVTERYQSRDGENKSSSTYLTCDWFTKSAEKMMEWIRKGRLVLVEGSIQVRAYEKDGQKQIFTSIRVASCQLCGGEAGEGRSEGGRASHNQSERPYAADRALPPQSPRDDSELDEIPF